MSPGWKFSTKNETIISSSFIVAFDFLFGFDEAAPCYLLFDVSSEDSEDDDAYCFKPVKRFIDFEILRYKCFADVLVTQFASEQVKIDAMDTDGVSPGCSKATKNCDEAKKKYIQISPLPVPGANDDFRLKRVVTADVK